MEEGNRSKAGPDMVVVLGISAIDVLCCALVCSLILFLMLSQARSSASPIQGKGTDKDLLMVFEVPAVTGIPSVDWPVLRVRAFAPTPSPTTNGINSSPLVFWSDESERVLPNSTDLLPPSMVQPDGGQVLWTSNALVGETQRISILQIHNPKPGYWGVEVGYVDSKTGLLSAATRDMSVRISIAGAVSSRFSIRIPLNSVCNISGDDCQKENLQGKVSKSLRVVGSL